MTKCFQVFPLFMEVFRSWLPTFSTAARASLVETLAPGRVSGRFLLGKRMKQHSYSILFRAPRLIQATFFRFLDVKMQRTAGFNACRRTGVAVLANVLGRETPVMRPGATQQHAKQKISDWLIFPYEETTDVKSVHLDLYMVIDLKVLVRSFNCESRACYVGNPRESFFRVREGKILLVSRKLGIIIIICKGLPPTAARGPAGEGHQRMRVAVAKFPKVRLCESQTPRPLVFAFPSVHPLLMAGVCE